MIMMYELDCGRVAPSKGLRTQRERLARSFQMSGRVSKIFSYYEYRNQTLSSFIRLIAPSSPSLS